MKTLFVIFTIFGSALFEVVYPEPQQYPQYRSIPNGDVSEEIVSEGEWVTVDENTPNAYQYGQQTQSRNPFE